MADILDLDALRQARREEKGETVTITFGGDDFVLPSELPLDVIEAFYLSENDGLRALFGEHGEDQWERFRSHRPTHADLRELSGWIDKVYDLGNSSEPQARSNGTGKRSKRTSKGSTRST